MTKRRPNPKAADRGTRSATRSNVLAPKTLDAVERFALLVLLALVPLRAVVAETHTFEVARLFRHLDAPTGAQPATTLLIVAVIAAVAVCVGAVRLHRGGRRYRWTGAEIGAGMLLLAGVVSFFQAGQKHLAMIGALDFLGMILYMLVLRQLLVRPWHIRLALVVVLATGAMMITKCADQHWFEYPQTIKYYEAEKLAQKEGPAEPGSRQSGLQHDFEQRLYAQTPTGYYAHPNLLGSHLFLIILTAVAVLSARFRESRPPWALLGPLAILAGAVVALCSTLSKGAMAACGIGIVLWLVWQFGSRRLAARPMLVLIGLWCVALIGTGVFIFVLKTKPDALGRSILFRSMYWDGAWDMLSHEGLLGVGPDNFGRHFTKYKSVECPEEVESPHSWPVKFATEWGVLGLAGIVILLFGVSFKLAIAKPALTHCDAPSADPPPGSVILTMAGLSAILFAWWHHVLADSPDVIGYAVIVLLIAACAWCISFGVLSAESKDFPLFADDALGPLLPALGAGLVAFLLHTGIDLALFAGGPATTFFALMAVALAVAGTDQEPPPAMTEKRKIAPYALGLGGLLIIVCFVAAYVFPAADVAENLKVARTNADPSPWNAYTGSIGYQAYQEAIEEYPLDGTAQSELIEQLIPRVRSLAHVETAIEIARGLEDRDPHNAIAYSHLAALYRHRYEFTKDIADLHRAIEARRKSIEAYPTSPNRHVELANFLENYADVTGDADARLEAARELQTALDLDAKRVYVSKPNRLTDEQKALLSERIVRLEGKESP